ncbi:hypothetical protein Trydic_g10275 [Trypoxylus dichotomus]
MDVRKSRTDCAANGSSEQVDSDNKFLVTAASVQRDLVSNAMDAIIDPLAVQIQNEEAGDAAARKEASRCGQISV